MAKKKNSLKGFEDLLGKLDAIDGDIKGTTEKCLKESAKIINSNAKQAMQRHNRTGRTLESLRENMPVTWSGTEAEIKVGFDVRQGLASIFLMYGTPKIPKDTKLYNAIYGSKTKKEVAKVQEDIINDAINNAMGG